MSLQESSKLAPDKKFAHDQTSQWARNESVNRQRKEPHNTGPLLDIGSRWLTQRFQIDCLGGHAIL